jgi:hypothetical protein
LDVSRAWIHCAFSSDYDSRYTPVPEQEFYNKIFRRIYLAESEIYQDVFDAHNLAVLYMVLALGTLFDLEKPPNSPEATHYYQLGRAALSLDSVLEKQTILAIQALVRKLILGCGSL